MKKKNPQTPTDKCFLSLAEMFMHMLLTLGDVWTCRKGFVVFNPRLQIAQPL